MIGAEQVVILGEDLVEEREWAACLLSLMVH